MIRFISFLLGKQYESCKSCETLKQQLAFERDEKKLLINTLIQIVSPKVVEAAPIEINQIQNSSALFSRRRAALEERDRQEAKILSERKHVAMPDILDPKNTRQAVNDRISDEVTELEKELGVTEGA